MKIVWNVEKKQGSHRPLLVYTMTLEDYEQDLALDAVNVLTNFPRLESPHQSYCLPETAERVAGWQPSEYHRIATPFFRDGERSGSLFLPFRESGNYPEIVESFFLIRKAHEEIVQDAYSWDKLSEEGVLDTTLETKELIASHIAAKKMLSF